MKVKNADFGYCQQSIPYSKEQTDKKADGQTVTEAGLCDNNKLEFKPILTNKCDR